MRTHQDVTLRSLFICTNTRSVCNLFSTIMITVTVLLLSLTLSSSFTAAVPAYLDWVEVGGVAALSTVVSLRDSDQIAEVGGGGTSDAVTTYALADVVETVNSKKGGFLHKGRTWKMPCSVCGPGNFAASLYGRFIVLVPRSGSASTGCSAEQKKQVLCLDTSSSDSTWTSIATLPSEMTSEYVSFTTIDHETSPSAEAFKGWTRLTFVTGSGAWNLTNSAPNFYAGENVCLSKSWSFGPQKTFCNANASSVAAQRLILAPVSRPDVFYASVATSSSTASPMRYVSVQDTCVNVAKENAAVPFPQAHAIASVMPPYLLSLWSNSNAQSAWIAHVFAPAQIPFSSQFPIDMNQQASMPQLYPTIFSPLPGLLLAVGNALDSTGCSTGNAVVYGAFVNNPRFANASAAYVNYELWKSLHNPNRDLLRVNISMRNGTTVPIDTFLSTNSSCATEISQRIKTLQVSGTAPTWANLTFTESKPTYTTPTPCVSAGICPTGTNEGAKCPVSVSSIQSCFEAGCCFRDVGSVCTYPVVHHHIGQPVALAAPILAQFIRPLAKLTPFKTYTRSAVELSATKSQSQTHSRAVTPPLNHTLSAPLSSSHTLARSMTPTPIIPDDGSDHTAAIVGACVGIIASFTLFLVCYIKRDRVKDMYRNATGSDNVDLLGNRLNNNGDDDDPYGTAAVGNADHTIEAVVQIEGADFAILKVAGRGAFGTVFQGKRLSDGALVAIKQVPLFTRSEVEDATKELETLLSVPYHKHILQVLVAGIRHGDAGQAGELPTVDRYARVRGAAHGAHHGAPLASMVLVTSFYKNGDLRGFVNSFKRAGRAVPPLACVSFAAQLCDVLDFLHKNKVIHRDVKPENLLLSDDYKSIVLTDFGLAKLTHVDNETLNTKAGSLPYVAPECFHGMYHATVDNWSVGSLMFAIVTKRVDSDNACVMYLEAHKPDFEQMIRRELGAMPNAYIEVVLGLLKDRPRDRLSLRDARKMLTSCIRESQATMSSVSLEAVSTRGSTL